MIDGHETCEDRSSESIKNLEGMGLDALIVTGGDGSQSIALKLFSMGVPVVGIPKTIDNDLMATDITFGFDTALNTCTDAIDKLHTTAESHHRVMVVEVMGRNTGWIAIESGIAGGADIILIPEIPFTFDNVAKAVLRRRDSGKKFSLVVVAEGACLPGGDSVSKKTGLGRNVLGGIGEIVSQELAALTGIDTRTIVLGHLQRGGTPSPFDRILATRFGAKAVEIIMDGDFGKMAALKTPNIVAIPLEEVVKGQRRVPPDGELVRFARAIGTSFGARQAYHTVNTIENT